MRLAEPVSILRFAGGIAAKSTAEPMTKPVVDTTAAGDSFAAAYIAARLGGADPVEAAQRRAPPRQCRGMLSRRDHSARGHAAEDSGTGPATTRQGQLK